MKKQAAIAELRTALKGSSYMAVCDGLMAIHVYDTFDVNVAPVASFYCPTHSEDPWSFVFRGQGVDSGDLFSSRREILLSLEAIALEIGVSLEDA